MDPSQIFFTLMCVVALVLAGLGAVLMFPPLSYALQKLAGAAIAAVWMHMKRHREIYFLAPLAIALCVASIAGVGQLTGRAVIDDPGAIVGWLYNFIGAVLIVILAGQVKPHLFDDIDTTDWTIPWWRVCIDSAETVFLLVFFAYLLRH